MQSRVAVAETDESGNIFSLFATYSIIHSHVQSLSQV
jgi:hypothetical protein